MTRLASSLAALTFVALAPPACSILFPSGDAPTDGPTTPTGCAATTKHVAPGGYYVNGNTVCTAAGQPHLFHGVDRPSLEWSPGGDHLSAGDFQLMSGWNANVVRIALNQDLWLADSPIASASYPATVDAAVKWAEEAGMDVILDLHWSDAGTLGSCTTNCQQLMADTNSITFWSQVAAVYKNDGRVLFELYNEPHDIPWSIWKSGGPTRQGWTAVGMQQLYNAVRATGADNLVIAGGLDYAFDLSGVPSNRIQGYNVLYATHPYGGNSDKGPTAWFMKWGLLTRTDPVIVTEFGDGLDCAGANDYPAEISAYSSSLISYADQHTASWTAWAWYPGGCAFPSLISDWTGTPTPPGTVVKAALAGYNAPAPGGKRDGGGAGGQGGAGNGDGGGGAAGAGVSPDDGGAGVSPDDGGAAGGGGQGGAAGADASVAG